jgi:hypothetical protein|tara:strand:- start:4519 stop:4818 length:300 start_codon:yes stop_codon:yes gene_type:complete
MANISDLWPPAHSTPTPPRQRPLEPAYGFNSNDGIVVYYVDHPNSQFNSNDGIMVSHEIVWDEHPIHPYDGNNGLVVGLEGFWDGYYSTSSIPGWRQET